MKAFASGHRNLTPDEFEEHYVPKLNEAMERGDEIYVCDYYGADQMVQEYLFNHEYENVRVVHMKDSPRFYIGEFPLIGGFNSDDERDSYCTFNTDYDIAWSRKTGSGTWQNLERRKAKDMYK